MNGLEISAELQVALGAIVGSLLALALSVVTLLQKRVETEYIKVAAEQAIAAAEAARLQRELAQLAAGQAEQTKQEIVTLGMALGGAKETGE